MNKTIITVMLSLITYNAFAYQTLNLTEYNSILNQNLKDTLADCADQNGKIKQGAIVKTLKEKRNLSASELQACSRDYTKILKQFCHQKIAVSSNMIKHVSTENIAEISKRFGTQPASSALGAVILYKTKKDLVQAQDNINASLERYVKRSRCELLREDGDIKTYLSNYFSEKYDLLDQTTLLVD